MRPLLPSRPYALICTQVLLSTPFRMIDASVSVRPPPPPRPPRAPPPPPPRPAPPPHPSAVGLFRLGACGPGVAVGLHTIHTAS